MSPDDKTVLITGAAGNLGRAVALAFAAQGARLALVDRDLASLGKAFGEEDDRTLFLEVDLLQADQAEAAVQDTVQRFGGLDVVCHLAGGFRMGEAVHETSPQTWDFLLGLNTGTLLNMARAAVPQMIRAGGGKIVHVGAYAAQHGAARMGAYIASKSAVIRLTETMAAELRDHNINVNCVLPSILDTPENRAAMPEADPARWVAPEDLARVIVFLASDAARAVHGAALPVTGLS